MSIRRAIEERKGTSAAFQRRRYDTQDPTAKTDYVHTKRHGSASSCRTCSVLEACIPPTSLRVWLHTSDLTSTISHVENKAASAGQHTISSHKMSHCHDEHDHHNHDHSEGAVHDHTDDLTPALQNHIYEQIDFSAVNTLNESEPRAGSKIVQKTWQERLDPEPELQSDADEQLLMHIPYAAGNPPCLRVSTDSMTASPPRSASTASSSAPLPPPPHP